MRIRLVILFVTLLHFLSPVSSQDLNDTISLSFRNLPLEIILDSISYKSGYYFSYNADIMPQGSLYSLKKDHVAVSELLELLFIGTDLEYSYRDDQVILKKVIADHELNKETKSSTISGWVRDEKSKEPIVGAHVFINGSTIGTTTDAYGNYKLFDVPPGNYIIVFSHVGYQLASYEMNANSPAHHKVNAALQPSVNLLKDLEISSMPIVDDIDWIDYYRKFSDQFIGNATNSSRCTFVNPEVLEFAHSDSLDRYEAVAKEPLVMINEGLGYRVIFNLDSYSCSVKEVRFHVTARFENLEVDSRRVRKRWEKNRERSYKGSKFHFFKALMADELDAEGFVMYNIKNLDEVNKLGTPIKASEVLFGSEKTHKFLKFEDYLVVIYRGELQSIGYQQDLLNQKSGYTAFPGAATRIDFSETTYQKSLLKLEKPELKVLSNGQIKDPENITAFGYWSWERMSELMPIDYDLKSDNL